MLLKTDIKKGLAFARKMLKYYEKHFGPRTYVSTWIGKVLYTSCIHKIKLGLRGQRFGVIRTKAWICIILQKQTSAKVGGSFEYFFVAISYFKGIKFRGSGHPRNLNISRGFNFAELL